MSEIKARIAAHRPVIFNFPVLEIENDEKYLNESGAGDSLSAGVIYGILNAYSLGNTIYNGILSAKLALLTSNNISADLAKIDLDKLNVLTNKNRPNIIKQYI